MSQTFEIVKSSLVHVLKNISILKNQQNAIREATDQDLREKLMIICFSPLSSWVLFLSLLVIYLNPFRYVTSIWRVDFLNDFVTHVLFSTDIRVIFLTGFSLFLISLFFKAEFILIALLGFLISNGDLHLRNALLFIPLIILGRLLQHLRLIRLLPSNTGRAWSMICALLLFSWLTTTGLVLNSFQFLSDLGVFSGSMHFLRFEVFTAAIFIYYFMEFLILSIWGHFYSLKLRS